MKRLSVVLWLVMLQFEVQPLFCQIGSIATGSVAPLETWNIAGRKMGGVSVGLADDAPTILANPANLASLDRPNIFLSLNNVKKNIDIQTNYGARNTRVSWSQGLDLGYSAVSLPFRLVDRRWVAAVSYNGRQWGEFDERYITDANELLGFGARSGHTHSLSAGLGIQVFSKIRAGVSWTAWSGTSTWSFSESNVEGSANNKAQGWQGGAAAEWGRLSLGLTTAFPRRVMNSRMTFYSWTAEAAEVSQKFNGSLDIGLGYHPWSRWTFGLGYGYQRGFDFESHDGLVGTNLEYPAFSKTSGGVEYRFSFDKVQLPIYAGYQAFWLHKPVEFLPYNILIPSSENKRFRSQLLVGAAAQIGYLAIYLNSRLTWDKFQLFGFAPPWS